MSWVSRSFLFWVSRSFLFWVSPLGYYFESETAKIMKVGTFPDIPNCSVGRPTLTVTFFKTINYDSIPLSSLKINGTFFVGISVLIEITLGKFVWWRDGTNNNRNSPCNSPCCTNLAPRDRDSYILKRILRLHKMDLTYFKILWF